MHPVESENSDVYAIMPMTTKVIGSLMTFKNSGIFLSETIRGLQCVLNTSIFRWQ